MATTKTVKLTATELKARRATAESNAAYGPDQKKLIKGLTTEVICQQTYDSLLVGDLDGAKDKIRALWAREVANRLTFHP